MNEENVKIKIVIPFLESLGFDQANLDFETPIKIHAGKSTYRIKPNGEEEQKDGDINIYYDILVSDIETGKNLFIVEVKNDNHKINQKDINQAFSYARLVHPMAPLFIITNGSKVETKLFNTITREEITEFDNNFADDNENLKIETNIDDYHDAIKYFLSYSKENLRRFCKEEYKLNAITLRSKEISDNKTYLEKVYAPNKNLNAKFDKFIKSEKKVFSLIGQSGLGKTC